MTDTFAQAVQAPVQPQSMPKRLADIISRLAADRSHDGIARRAALFAFLIRVASAAIAYAAQIVLARWIGTFDYGIYVFVWTWVLVLGNLSGLGFGTSAARFLPAYQDAGRMDEIRGFLRASRLAGLIAATVVALIGMAAINLMAGYLASYYVAPLLLACICLPMFALTETQDGIARCFDAPGIALVPPYILRPILLFAVMFLAHQLGFALDAGTAMQAAIIATWLAAIMQWLMLERNLSRRLPAGRRVYELRLWLSSSLPLFVAESARVLLFNVDVLILTAFASPDQVGIYYAVTKTLVLGAFVSFAVGAAVTHRFSEYHVAGDTTRLQDFIAKSASWTFWPTLAAVILMLALGRPFLSLFGPSFVSGYPLMLILSFGVIARAAIGPAERLLAALGGQRAYAQVFVAILLIGILLNGLLVPFFGATGAAIAVALGALIETGFIVYAVRARLGYKVGIWTARR